MKLILIPDEPNPRLGPCRPRVAISIPGDDHTIHDIIEKLVTPALVGFSFPPQTIQDGYDEAAVMGAVRADEREQPSVLLGVDADDGGDVWSDPTPTGRTTREWLETLPPAPKSKFPELPPVPKGYARWSEPELCPTEYKFHDTPMAFYHDDEEEEHRWLPQEIGGYGGLLYSYPIYYIKALKDGEEADQ